MQDKQPLSIIVPTLNEADNVPTLLARIEASLTPHNIPYEVIIVDDHSSDGTIEVTRSLTNTYPVRLILKDGKRGKAYSLLQGFEEAANDLIVMIDADLQYPPEAIAPMYELQASTNADVVVTRRHETDVKAIRKLSTKVFNLVFARLLFGISFDTQSGLKLFKKRILNSFTMTPSPWSFDLEFLVRALENNYTIVSHDILFGKRSFGDTKVRLLGVTYELSKASLQLRWRTSASRVRAGHHANNQFLEKALQIVVVTGLIMASSLAFAPPSQALNLPKPITHIVNQVTGNKGGTAKVPDSSGTTNSVSPTPAATPTVASPSQSSQSAATATSAASAGTTTSATPVVATRTAAAAKPAVTTANNSDLAPATAVKNSSSLYGGTYPNYKLSRQTNNTLFNAGQFAWITGAICLVAAIITSGIRATHRLGTSVISRS